MNAIRQKVEIGQEQNPPRYIFEESMNIYL